MIERVTGAADTAPRQALASRDFVVAYPGAPPPGATKYKLAAYFMVPDRAQHHL